MKCCCISDTHCNYKQLVIPDGDVLIHAGDIDAYQYSSELKDFNKWLGRLPHKYKIVIAGNHDGYISITNRDKVRKYLDNAIYLENSGCEIDGINFWGSPITPAFLSWFFMATRGEEIQNKYWSKISRNTDVLITHGPPYGIRDKVLFPKEESVGCSDLLWTVKQLKPKIHIFGHIHSGYGITKTKDTVFINASVMDEEYDIVNEPIEVTI